MLGVKKSICSPLYYVCEVQRGVPVLFLAPTSATVSIYVQWTLCKILWDDSPVKDKTIAECRRVGQLGYAGASALPARKDLLQQQGPARR